MADWDQRFAQSGYLFGREPADFLRLRDYDAEIDEGEGHSGRSALIDLIARKI